MSAVKFRRFTRDFNDTLSRLSQITCIWTIENVSKLTQISVKSPSFVAHPISKVEWYLEIEELLHICCILKSEDARKELPFDIGTEFSFLAADGSPLVSKEGDEHAFCIFLMTKEAFMERVDQFISNNTLTVQFRMWRRLPVRLDADIIFARTKLKTYTRSFVWPIEKFSTLNSTAENDFNKLAKNEKKIYPLKNFTENRHIVFILYLKRNSESEDVCVDFVIGKGTDYGYKCEIAVLDANGVVIASKVEGERSHFRRKILKFRNLIVKSKLIGNKNLFLPDDTLYLRCSVEVCTGVTSNEIEFCTPDISPVAEKKEVSNFHYAQMNADDSLEFEEHFIKDTDESVSVGFPVEEKIDSNSCKKSCNLRAALSYLHCETILSDVSLQIGRKLYPVHKNILSSRSSVFKTIFSKSTEDNIFEIHDMDENTFYRLLQYMYTDTIGDLQFENSLELFEAAAVYQLFDLKDKCSDFLIASLSKANTLDILYLAKKYQDKKLEMAVEYFESGLKDQHSYLSKVNWFKAKVPIIPSLAKKYQDKNLEVSTGNSDSVLGKKIDINENTKNSECNLF